MGAPCESFHLWPTTEAPSGHYFWGASVPLCLIGDINQLEVRLCSCIWGHTEMFHPQTVTVIEGGQQDRVRVTDLPGPLAAH